MTTDNEIQDGFDHNDQETESDIRKRMDNLKNLWSRAGMFRAVKETNKLDHPHWMDGVD